MALVKRTITNAGRPFTSQAGAIQGGIEITFRLVNKKGKAVDAWDTFTSEWVPSEEITVQTDINGVFTVNLWPTSRATMEVYYLCTMSGSPPSRFIAPLMDGPGELTWAAFRNSADLQAAEQSAFVAHVQDTSLHAGINKVIIVDAITDVAYRLVIESAELKLMELAPDNYGYIDYILQDYVTGTRYRLIVENTALKLEEI